MADRQLGGGFTARGKLVLVEGGMEPLQEGWWSVGAHVSLGTQLPSLPVLVT